MRKHEINVRQIVAVVLSVILLAGLFGGVALYERTQARKLEAELRARGAELESSLWTDDNTVSFGDQMYGFDHRLETFLFLGTDASSVVSEDPEEYHGPMADFVLLMILDHTQNSIGYIQIDRNTVTDVDELDKDGVVIDTRELQICTAHWYGRSPEMSAENTVAAVKHYLGDLENIDGYYVINMKDIGALNHTVGGVTVTIEDDMDAADSEFTKGKTLLLSDDQAEAFLRARMNVGEGDNASREVRQRQYMASFFKKVREMTTQDPEFGIKLWDMLKDVAVTNMNGNDFSRIAQKLLKGEDKGIHTIKGKTVLGYILQDGVEHEEFYADEDSKRDEMIEMFSLVPIEDDEYIGDEEWTEDEDMDDEDDEDWEDDEEEDDEDLDSEDDENTEEYDDEDET